MSAIDLRSAAAALGGDVAGRNRILVPGPGHSRRDRSLAVTFADSGFLVHSFAGDDFRECRDHVKAALGVSDDKPRVAFNDNRQGVDPERLRKQQDALSIWACSVPIAGTLAERYLASRRLQYSGDALRFWQGGRAMVALISDAMTGEPLGIHRTFLDRDGRKVDRKMLGIAAGGVVRLSGDDSVTYGLAIAEEIETALAAPFRPIWACLSAGTMRNMPVLSGIEALSIFADHDKAGIEAAQECAERWHADGKEVSAHLPVEQDADFASMLEAA